MLHFNLKPGKAIGEIKSFITEAILEGEIPNERSAALELMIQRGVAMGLELKHQ